MYTMDQGFEYTAHGNTMIWSVNKLFWDLKHFKNLKQIEPGQNGDLPWENSLCFNQKLSQKSSMCLRTLHQLMEHPNEAERYLMHMKPNHTSKRLGIVMGYLRWFLQWVVTPTQVEKGSIWVQRFVGFNWMVQLISKGVKRCVNHESSPKHFWKSYDESDDLNFRSENFGLWHLPPAGQWPDQASQPGIEAIPVPVCQWMSGLRCPPAFIQVTV